MNLTRINGHLLTMPAVGEEGQRVGLRKSRGRRVATGIGQEAHPARWEELDHPEAVIRYDKRNRPYNADAGPARNAEMVAAGAEMCLAFHRTISASKVTRDCVKRAISAGIPTYRIDSERAEPKRLRVMDASLR